MGPLDDITFGGGGLDRAAEIRGDSRAVAALVAQPGTRVLPLWRGRVLLEEGRLTGLPPDHALFDGAPEAAVLLGRDSAGAAILARPIADWPGAPEVADPAETVVHPSLGLAGFAELRGTMATLDPRDAELAAMARPVKVGYGRDGLGATLTLLTTGAQAPMLSMQCEAIRERVNACYGYRAIAKVRITQTAPTGFAEGEAAFAPAAKPVSRSPDPEVTAQAARTAQGVGDTELRLALEALGANVFSKHRN